LPGHQDVQKNVIRGTEGDLRGGKIHVGRNPEVVSLRREKTKVGGRSSRKNKGEGYQNLTTE